MWSCLSSRGYLALLRRQGRAVPVNHSQIVRQNSDTRAFGVVLRLALERRARSYKVAAHERRASTSMGPFIVFFSNV